jgi:hypothetical protein
VKTNSWGVAKVPIRQKGLYTIHAVTRAGGDGKTVTINIQNLKKGASAYAGLNRPVAMRQMV